MDISFTVGWLSGIYALGVVIAYSFICMANWDDTNVNEIGGKGRFMVASIFHSVMWPLTVIINILTAIIRKKEELFKKTIRLTVSALIGKEISTIHGPYNIVDSDVERINRRLRRLSHKKLYQLARAIDLGYIDDLVIIRAVKMTIVERQVLGCDDYDEEL